MAGWNSWVQMVKVKLLTDVATRRGTSHMVQVKQAASSNRWRQVAEHSKRATQVSYWISVSRYIAAPLFLSLCFCSSASLTMSLFLSFSQGLSRCPLTMFLLFDHIFTFVLPCFFLFLALTASQRLC